MVYKFYFSVVSLLLISQTMNASRSVVAASDRICGKWISEKKNCIVQVCRENGDFAAKLVWFDDGDDKSKPMDTRTDYKNPDANLRSRKLIGMNVVEELEYIAKSNSWENGMIYDAQSGKKWNSSASINDQDVLKVTGYWHFKFIGKSMNFYRVQ